MGDKLRSKVRKSPEASSVTGHELSKTPTTLLDRPNKNLAGIFACALLVFDAVLILFIIAYVPYTKIDWDAYMSQVSEFLNGERDYSNIEGDTGPLVYPAGFLYVYTAIQYITGGLVHPAQILFGALYIINLAIVFFIYIKTDVLPWWALTLLCLSKRVHSIFVLRLFNDCIATTLLHAALATLLYQKWWLGLIIFSLAVSIKMNVLLFAPSLLLLMLKAMDISGTIVALGGAAFVQILLGFPFLVSYPVAYVSGAFNLGRVFIHFWSVNFKFVPEPVFVSKAFAVSLLILHLGLLAIFAHKKWCKHEGGLVNVMHSVYISTVSRFPLQGLYAYGTTSKTLNEEHIVTTMFVGNFIGIICARSLHYQFYSWYFFSVPYLLWKTPFPTPLRIALFVAVEYCWNVYPSNNYSSGILVCIHLMILWGLWIAPPEYPYMDDKSPAKRKKR
ncbi:hypothetical protein SOVF_060290 isoform A [Spinacia oleracea]|uniref:dolichyl-P-Man:Man5GlcNAc2-PP-dolichol alpha-1,3-mannosyltransferase n=1 Tax=Spinacia oleracea TaxID=3562 RepID=A0A9R0IZ59_SPIOL|nr:dol-P-Man:Man(5)GlcNAc(2)-PP-Dol alpha-1,3-mannosyltransferase isoform X1 [Spinacia oleracea]XP_056697048.1 dol-P-Man:Man(5)GlcNAc(2)-PP-Dol alpha-1,3-mannosyltransferase isoform X1 [Spinacia oleracea]KNA19570.1 hypothetical protein SOVF_060290 isoform A [Spinacia oleracea]